MSVDEELRAITSPFDASPTSEELNQSIAQQPWILRKRITLQAYKIRCSKIGKNAEPGEWLSHIKLDADELTLLNDLIESQRQGFCVDELGPKFVIRDYGNRARVGWFNSRDELCVMSIDEFKKAHLEKTTQVVTDGKIANPPLVDFWLKHPLTTRYDAVEYRPGVEQSQMPEGILNLWRGWPRGLKPGWAETRLGDDGAATPSIGNLDSEEMPEECCRKFLDHMFTNMCGDDEVAFMYLLGWMADSLWNPGPCDTAVVLMGPQGSGKTLWAELFMQFFGPHSITLDDDEQLTGHFNKHLMDKSVVFADEAFFAGNGKQAAKLKTIVTKPDLFVEPKGVDGFVAPKMFRLIMASNDDHVIRAERDDRRYFVLNVDAKDHNQDKDYFAAIVEEWNHGGRRALFRWLTGKWWGEQVSERRFRKMQRPITSALQDQKDQSLSAPHRLIHNMLMSGEPGGDYLLKANTDTIFIATQLLLEAARLDLKFERALGSAIAALADEKAKVSRETLGDGRLRRQYKGKWLPPLSVCRTRWETFLGRSISWPSDVTRWDLSESPRQEQNAPF